MQRTIISLEPECREWLAEQALREHVPQTEVVRRALRLYREKATANAPQSFEELARLTSGLQRGEDGLAIQQRLRDEWVDR
jgi:Arc/MetJ-type ribon-helix-helix transcriptional regulator